MGGRGGFIKESGFNKYRYEIVDFVDGVKVLEPRDKREAHNLPERSKSPCTSYMCLIISKNLCWLLEIIVEYFYKLFITYKNTSQKNFKVNI